MELCYKWFRSKLEKDVSHYLLKGNQPIIVVLARGLKQKIEPEFLDAIEKGRLLIITPFEEKIKRVTVTTVKLRNQMMIKIADNIVIGFANEEVF